VETASGELAGPVIDRLQDRALASVVLELEPHQVRVIGAGVAATGSRLTIAAALARANLPRPAVFATHDEASGLEAAREAGYPAAFLPLEPKVPGLTLWDADTAEAVLEHRAMLGQRVDTLGLVQAGTGLDRIRVIVAGGAAIGYEGDQALASEEAFGLAVAAAGALKADLVGVDLIASVNGSFIWDIDPVPDFRNATPVGCDSVAMGIARLVESHVHLAGSTHAAIGGRA
jgi:glutathione synthase/RimK-type ligase-like ATP-grasp enzyme